MNRTQTLPRGEVTSRVPSVERQIVEIFKSPSLAALSFEGVADDSKLSREQIDKSFSDLHAKTIENLRKTREELLKELHVDGIEEALNNPALYFQEVIAGFAEKCTQRMTVSNHKDKEGVRFATVRHSQRPDGTDRVAKGLDMSMQFGYDGKRKPQLESCTVGVEFQNGLNEEPNGYIFHTNGEELTIQQRYWNRGQWQYKDVDDEVEYLTLCQALATDMLWAERNFSREDNEAAKDLVQKDTLVDNY